jgi:hypothetical protein
MVFRSHADRTLAALDRVLSADVTLARLVTLFAEPPRAASPGRSPSTVARRLVRRPMAPHRKVLLILLAVAVPALLGGAVVTAVAGLPSLAVVCGVTAGVGAVWLLTEIVGRTVFSAHGRHRLPRTKRAHPQRRSGR